MEDPKFYTPEKIVRKYDVSELTDAKSPTEWQPGAFFQNSDIMPLSAPIPVRKISYDHKQSDLDLIDEDLTQNVKFKLPHLITRHDCVVEVFNQGSAGSAIGHQFSEQSFD